MPFWFGIVLFACFGASEDYMYDTTKTPGTKIVDDGQESIVINMESFSGDLDVRGLYYFKESITLPLEYAQNISRFKGDSKNTIISFPNGTTSVVANCVGSFTLLGLEQDPMTTISIYNYDRNGFDVDIQNFGIKALYINQRSAVTISNNSTFLKESREAISLAFDLISCSCVYLESPFNPDFQVKFKLNKDDTDRNHEIKHVNNDGYDFKIVSGSYSNSDRYYFVEDYMYGLDYGLSYEVEFKGTGPRELQIKYNKHSYSEKLGYSASSEFPGFSDIRYYYGIKVLDIRGYSKSLILTSSQISPDLEIIADDEREYQIDFLPDGINKTFSINLVVQGTIKLGSISGDTHIKNLVANSATITLLQEGNFSVSLKSSKMILHNGFQDDKISFEFGNIEYSNIILPYGKNLSIPRVKAIPGSLNIIMEAFQYPIVAYSSENELELEDVSQDFTNKITLESDQISNIEDLYSIQLVPMEKTTTNGITLYGIGANLTLQKIEYQEKVCYKISPNSICPEDYKIQVSDIGGMRNISDLHLTYDNSITEVEIPVYVINNETINIHGNGNLLDHQLTLKFTSSTSIFSIGSLTLSNGYFSLNTGNSLSHNRIEKTYIENSVVTGISYLGSFLYIDSNSSVEISTCRIYYGFIKSNGKSIGSLKCNSFVTLMYIEVIFDEVEEYTLENPVFFNTTFNMEENSNYKVHAQRSFLIDTIYFVNINMSNSVGIKSYYLEVEKTNLTELKLCYRPDSGYECIDDFIPVESLDRYHKVDSIYVAGEYSSLKLELYRESIFNGVDIYTADTGDTLSSAKEIVVSYETSYRDKTEELIKYVRLHGHSFYYNKYDYTYAENIIIDDAFLQIRENGEKVEILSGYLQTSVTNLDFIKLHYGGSKPSGILMTANSLGTITSLPEIVFNGQSPSGNSLSAPFIKMSYQLYQEFDTYLKFENQLIGDDVITLKCKHVSNNMNEYILTILKSDGLHDLFSGITHDQEKPTIFNLTYLTNIRSLHFITAKNYSIDVLNFQNITISGGYGTVVDIIGSKDSDVAIETNSEIILNIRAKVNDLAIKQIGCIKIVIPQFNVKTFTIQSGGKFYFESIVPDSSIVLQSENPELFFSDSIPSICVVGAIDLTVTALFSKDVAVFDNMIKISDEYFFLSENLKTEVVDEYAIYRCEIIVYTKIYTPKLCIGDVKDCPEDYYHYDGYSYGTNMHEVKGFSSIEEIVFYNNNNVKLLLEGLGNNIRITTKSTGFSSAGLLIIKNCADKPIDITLNGSLSIQSSTSKEYDNTFLPINLNHIEVNSGIINLFDINSNLTINKEGRASIGLSNEVHNEEIIVNYYNKIEPLSFYFGGEYLVSIPYVTLNLFAVNYENNEAFLSINSQNHGSPTEEQFRNCFKNRYKIVNKHENCEYEIKEATYDYGYMKYDIILTSKSMDKCTTSDPLPSSHISSSQVQPPIPNTPEEVPTITVDVDKEEVILTDKGVEGVEIPDSGIVIVENEKTNFTITGSNNVNNGKANIYVGVKNEGTTINIEKKDNYENVEYGISVNEKNPTV
ncbi:hypothetical protein TRFO_18371 [Tritrichomonas foetus]|uniref:Uncharacterized protein n=1 Tax=Tritrichomonas foetus TaxID=1144522 RepID=A0A1J4KLH4_9EUKA|nr:hypothetical protein TRFO_18371 [Tritrichomonas foetus]|eukprot:OHT11986.1 hypothetical protein TRFO_18371 [Tritrichomonas foetus]